MDERNLGMTTPPAAAHRWQLLEVQPFPCLIIEVTGGRVVYSNAAARDIGLDRATGGGREAYYAENAGRRIDSLALARHLVDHASGNQGLEITWHTPGRWYAFQAFCRPLPPPHGELALAVLTFLDITRQKTAEEELRQALEARDEFFSVATHELKDPLFSLQLSVQLLRRSAVKLGPIPAHVLQHLEVSERQLNRLSRLIENLLDVARVMNRRIRLDVEPVDLCELARETVGRFLPQAEQARTPLTLETDAAVIGYFDRLKLEQVLGNLLSNALKYGAGQPVTVRVRGEENAAVLEVQDRGVGIPPEEHERVFQRFERASEGHRKESLGLGLYIVRSLVEAHGGTIQLTSQPGVGSTFTVLLPRLRLYGEEPNHRMTP